MSEHGSIKPGNDKDLKDTFLWWLLKNWIKYSAGGNHDVHHDDADGENMAG